MRESYLVTIIRWLAYAACVVPLVFSVNFYSSYAAPQTFLFRLIVELMCVVWIALVLKDSSCAPRMSLFLWAFAAWCIASFVSGILGADPQKSFFSDFDRHWGVLTLLHLFLFALVVQSVLFGKKEWRRLFSVFAGVSAVSALYGLWQFASGSAAGRIWGTVGNPAFFASYLLFGAVIALWLSREESAGGRWRFLWWGIIALNALVAVLTGTRAAALALVAGALVYVGFLIFGNSSSGKIKRMAAMFICVCVLVVFGGFMARNTAFMREHDLGRLFQISISEVTAQTRLIGWQAGWQGFLDKPLLGVGPENFNVAFNKHFNADYYTYDTGETNFTRAHNIFLEQLTTGGIIVFLMYLALFAALFWIGRAEVMMFVFLAVYTVQGFFGVDVFTSLLPLALFGGYFATKDRDLTENSAPSGSFGFANVLTVGIVCVVVGYAGWALNLKPAFADVVFSDAYALNQNIVSLDPKTASETGKQMYQNAIAFSIYGSETMRSSLAEFTNLVYLHGGKDLPGFKDVLLPFAFSQVKADAAAHPFDYLVWATLGQLYNIHLYTGGASDPTLEASLHSAGDLAPKRLELPLIFAQHSLIVKDYDAAAAQAEKGIAINPHYLDFYRVAFLAYSLKGDEENAFRILDAGVGYNLELTSASQVSWLLAEYKNRGMGSKAGELQSRYASLLSLQTP